MKKIIIFLLSCLLAAPAFAQSVTMICIPTTNAQGVRSCQNVAVANPLPVTGTFTLAPASSASNYTSATVTASSTQMLAAATTRAFLDLFNASTTATIACNLGGTAVINGAGSITIPPGWHYSWDGTYVPADAVNCIASAGSTPMTIGSK